MTTATDRPTALAVIPDTIPATLRARPAWLLWRYDRRGAKWTKVPVNAATGRNASATDPATWTDHATALAAHQSGRFASDGIGIVLTGDGLTALDFDACIGADGIAPDVAADLAGLATYAERSPSGTGVRAFVLADLPPGGNRRGPFEAYDRARFVTITGHRLDGATEISGDASALAAWHARRIARPERPATPATTLGDAPATAPATAAAVGPFADDDEIIRRCGIRYSAKFRRLFHDGDVTGNGGDPSGADFALAAMFVYAGADATQVDRLMRQSALMRPKWDSARGGRTWLADTIASAYEREQGRWTDVATATFGEREIEAATRLADEAGGDPERVRALVIDLERERDRLRAERDRAAAERDHANGTIRSVWSILGNSNLGAARVVAVAAFMKLDAVTHNHAGPAPDDGMHKLTAQEIGTVVGLDAATASRHLRTLSTLPDSPLRRELRIVEVVDDDGLIVDARKTTYLGMTTETAIDFAEAVARLEGTGKRHGGSKPRSERIRACPDHPDAPVRLDWHATCSDCGKMLGEGSATIAPPAEPEPIEADFKLQTDPDPTPVVVTPIAHHEIGIPSARRMLAATRHVYVPSHDASMPDPATEPARNEDADGIADADFMMKSDDDPAPLRVTAPGSNHPTYGRNRERAARESERLAAVGENLRRRSRGERVEPVTDPDPLGRLTPDTPEQRDRDRDEAERERRELDERVAETVQRERQRGDEPDGALPLPLTRSERADLFSA